ncbi:MAG: hypothetical protein JWQ63_1856 [Mucilaginibacter sp.]|nr:hypothetical protein [Mucilaginibacter sp.]
MPVKQINVAGEDERCRPTPSPPCHCEEQPVPIISGKQPLSYASQTDKSSWGEQTHVQQ